MMAKDIVFYINRNDWRKECKACLYEDFKEEKMQLLEADYTSINNVFHKQNITNWKINRVDVRYKDESSNTYHNIKWTEFDPRKMNIIDNPKTEFNILNIIKSGKAPGLVEKVDKNRGSVMHKGKVDEGAMEDLLDKSLPKAKLRANERQVNQGHAFTKNISNKTLVRRK